MGEDNLQTEILEGLKKKISQLLNSKDLPQALLIIENALELNPKDDELIYLKGYILLEQGKPEDAIFLFNLAIDYNPGNEKYYFKRGCANLALELLNEAQSDFELALEINPNSAQTKQKILELDIKNKEKLKRDKVIAKQKIVKKGKKLFSMISKSLKKKEPEQILDFPEKTPTISKRELENKLIQYSIFVDYIKIDYKTNVSTPGKAKMKIEVTDFRKNIANIKLEIEGIIFHIELKEKGWHILKMNYLIIPDSTIEFIISVIKDIQRIVGWDIYDAVFANTITDLKLADKLNEKRDY